jgi:hypothetical protein
MLDLVGFIIDDEIYFVITIVPCGTTNSSLTLYLRETALQIYAHILITHKVGHLVAQKYTATCFMLVSILDYRFDPEDGGDMFLRNICRLKTDYMALYPRRYNSPEINLRFPLVISWHFLYHIRGVMVTFRNQTTHKFI